MAAHVVRQVRDLLAMSVAEAQSPPRHELLKTRGDASDPAIKRRLVAARIAHLFPVMRAER